VRVAGDIEAARILLTVQHLRALRAQPGALQALLGAF
jgi:hypothetical protein